MKRNYRITSAEIFQAFKLKKNILLLALLGISGITNAQTYLLGPQAFNTDILVHGSSAATTVWFAPDYNTPIDFLSTGGCSGSCVGYSGSWNNYWGNFLRLPEVNCSGKDTVLLTFNVSNSYFAAQPNDWCRFYVWADNGYKHNVVSVKINGIDVTYDSGVNGKGFKFSTLRNCDTAEVKFDLSAIVNKTNILFYLEPNCGYNNSNTFFVKFDNVAIVASECTPAVTPDAGNNGPVCAGDALYFTSSGGETYAWSGPAGYSSNIQNPAIPAVSAVNAGIYTVTVTNAQGCTNTATTAVTVFALPSVSTGSNSPICTGDTLELSSSGGTIYSWSGPGDFISSMQNPSVVNADNTDSGTYTVTVTNADGCSAVAVIDVTVNALPSQPLITQSDDTLFATSGSLMYYWYLDSTCVYSNTVNYFLPAVSGMYYVEVLNIYGCHSALSDGYYYQGVGKEVLQYDNITVSIYPNPFESYTIINLYGYGDLEFDAEILDYTGKSIYEYRNNTGNRLIIERGSVAAGLYFVRLSFNDGTVVSRKLVVR